MKNFETKAIRIQSERTHNREHSVPMYLTSSFLFDDAEQARALFAKEIEGNIYSRFTNPNTDEFVDKLAALEGCESGVSFATGMAAVFGSMAALLEKGDHIVASRAVFGSTHQLFNQIFPKWGITHTYVDGSDKEAWENAIRDNTKMLFCETPSNPGLQLVDLEFLSDLKKKYGLLLNVDNCFATPYLQWPTEFGVDIITHSATKYIDGQGRVLGGAVLGSKEIMEEVGFFARQSGPALSPFNAWVLSKSLETLAVRMEAHCKNAMALAEKLTDSDQVSAVHYPFLKSHSDYELATKQMKLGGGIVTFEVKGGFEQARKTIDRIKLLSVTANLGDTRTTVTHPASTTHSKLNEEEQAAVGITPGLIRISVGLEQVDDILDDIDQALRAE